MFTSRTYFIILIVIITLFNNESYPTDVSMGRGLVVQQTHHELPYNLGNIWQKNQQSEHPVLHLAVTEERMLRVGHSINFRLQLNAYLHTAFINLDIEVIDRSFCTLWITLEIIKDVKGTFLTVVSRGDRRVIVKTGSCHVTTAGLVLSIYIY